MASNVSGFLEQLVGTLKSIDTSVQAQAKRISDVENVVRRTMDQCIVLDRSVKEVKGTLADKSNADDVRRSFKNQDNHFRYILGKINTLASAGTSGKELDQVFEKGVKLLADVSKKRKREAKEDDAKDDDDNDDDTDDDADAEDDYKPRRIHRKKTQSESTESTESKPVDIQKTGDDKWFGQYVYNRHKFFVFHKGHVRFDNPVSAAIETDIKRMEHHLDRVNEKYIMSHSEGHEKEIEDYKSNITKYFGNESAGAGK